MTQELNLGLWVVGRGRPRGVTQELNLGRWVGLGRTQIIRSQGRACFDVPQGKSVFCVTLCEVPMESRSPGLSRRGQCEVDVLCDR